MKRIFAVFLVITLLAVLCACETSSAEKPTTAETIREIATTAPESNEVESGGPESTETVPNETETVELLPGELLVGHARVDITPRITTPLRGFGGTSSRMSNTILEPLYASCVAITGENRQTVLIIAIDLITTEFVDKLIPVISERTGVPVDNIFINASHTHAAPDVANGSKAFYYPYMRELEKLFADVAVTALLDRAPAQMSYGSIETERMTFTRHYQYSVSGGEMGYSFGAVDAVANSGMAEHVTQPDETMHVIRFGRENGNDIVMVNWRAHPLLHSGKGRLELSADFISGFRRSVELTEDVHFVYLQGASGNMNSITAIPSEVRTEDNHEYGAIMADYSLECLSNMTKAENTRIRTAQTMLEAKVYHETDSLYEAALGLTGDSFKENSYGIRSKHHATHIIDRYRRGETEQLELNAVAIGNAVAFVTAPDELFDTNIVELEAQSPFAMNFALTLTNGHMGYLPSLIAWEYTCYETDVTTYVPGTAEQVRDAFLSMLDQMAGK